MTSLTQQVEARERVAVFAILAGVVLLLSLGGPLTLPLPAAQQGVLVLLHLVTAVAVVGILWRCGRKVT